MVEAAPEPPRTMSTHYVLMIDPDPDSRSICETLLRHEGYRVSLATDHASGLRLAREEPPAVIITELLGTPSERGEIIRDLKRHPQTGSIPIIVLTGWAGAGDREAAGAAEGFLPKPFRLADLLQELQRVCPAAAEPEEASTTAPREPVPGTVRVAGTCTTEAS